MPNGSVHIPTVFHMVSDHAAVADGADPVGRR